MTQLAAFITFLLLGISGPSLAETLPILDSNQDEAIEPGTFLEYIFDPGSILDIEAIHEASDDLAWIRSNRSTPSFGYRQGAVWARLSIQDLRTDRIPLILEVAYPPLDQIDVYIMDGAIWKNQRAGDHVPREKWALDTRNPTFRILTAENGKETIIYIRIHGSSSLSLPMKIVVDPAYQKKMLLEESIQSLYFGALLILGIYNLLVFLSSGLKFYAAYVIFLVGYGTFQAAFGGQWHFYVTSSSPVFSDYATVIGMNLISIGLSAFVLSVFELKNIPRIRKIWQGCGYTILLTSMANLCALFFLPYHVVIKIVFFLGFVGTIYSLASVILGFHQRERMAKWFLLAWSFFLFGSIVNILRSLGIVGSNTWTIYSQQIGSAVEFTLLSFAMADRIKIMQNKINQQNENALKAEQAAREADQRALEASEASLAEQKRLAALKDQFLANTSHELRTPLNGMIGMSEALLDRKRLQQDEITAVQEILGASRQLSKLVNEILDFNASKEGKIEINLESVELNELLKTSLAQQVAIYADKAISIQNHLPSDRIYIKADINRCQQVLNAILSNAFKFNAKGRITLRSKVEDDAVELLIRDTGIGIAADRLENFNKVFEQGDGNSARKQGGTGLGLALAQRLITDQGGTLQIQSAVGLGTTVILRFQRSKELPFQQRMAASDGLNLSSPMPQQFIPSPKASTPPLQLAERMQENPIQDAEACARILVVDDDNLNRRVIREHLIDGPYEVREAASGAEALHLIANEPRYDAVLLDVMMPGMTGYEVACKIRENYSPTDLPILMLTAKQQVQDLVEGFQSGANDYVHKPFVKDELLTRLHTHLSISKTARAMRRFVPHDFIQILGHQNLTDLRLGEAVSRTMSILFADIAGFTKILESMQASEVFAWLNNCYRIIGPEIRQAGGFIDKYIGDAVMALFPGYPDDAVAAAISMHRGIKEIEGTKIGTGIHWGQTMLGTLGEPERFETTVLADSVNIASRIEGVSKLLGCHIVVSSHLKQAMLQPEIYHWRSLGSIRLKGRCAAIELYEVLDADKFMNEKLSNIDEFRSGLLAFQSGQFLQAGLHFQSVLDALPEDGPARFYRERCQKMHEFKGEFDGSLHLNEKN